MAQDLPPASAFDQATAAQLKAQSSELLQQALASPSGMASITLKKYTGHYTMLTARTKSGGAEEHDHVSDFFIVLSGEATEVIGGNIEAATSSSPGEIRGKKVDGGSEHLMQTGDIVHIAPGTPHQTLVKPGQTFIYYVIKVEQ